MNPACVGLAPLRGVCKPTLQRVSIGVSVIEMQSPHSDIACAHELGHKYVNLVEKFVNIYILQLIKCSRFIKKTKQCTSIIRDYHCLFLILNNSVGSPHDGQAGEGEQCVGSNGNVMNPVVNRPSETTTPNLYLFSPCSRASISNTIQGTTDGWVWRHYLDRMFASGRKVNQLRTSRGKQWKLISWWIVW